MAFDSIPLNQKQADPNLQDLLTLFKKDIMLSLNCHAIATVQSFDPTKQVISATINYKKSFLKRDPVTGVNSMQLVDYPILLDVPVVVLSGGLFNLTFPIAVGDECLILFNDRNIDNWFQSGQVGAVANGRLHSFSDGIAIVGVKSLLKVLATYDMTHALLSNGQTQLGISATQVRIANTLTTLNGALQDLVTNLNSLITQTSLITVICAAPASPSSPPVNAPAIAAIAAQLAATSAKISGLLE